MIVGIGLDVIELARIERSLARHGDALVARLLSERERAFAAGRRGSARVAHLAGRFAAKEAALKALGTGLAAGIRWHEVEILADALHEPPRLEWSGAARERARRLGAAIAHVSISHGDTTAVACVILERLP